MFHEFGHALHGMFSDVKYPRFAGTSVPRDFVEYPSQVNEMWATWPEVLRTTPSTTRPASRCRRSCSTRCIAAAEVQPGLRDDRVPRRRACSTRPGTSVTPAELPGRRRRARVRGRRARRTGVDFAPVPPRYRTHLLLATSSRAATRPATTPTSGAKCSTRQRRVVQEERRPHARERRPLPQDAALARRQRRRDDAVPRLPRRRSDDPAVPGAEGTDGSSGEIGCVCLPWGVELALANELVARGAQGIPG